MSHPRATTASSGLVVAWMSGALACFVVAAIAVRELSRHLNVFEIGVARTGMGLLLVVAALAAAPSLRAQIVFANGLLHVPRNFIHAIGGVAWTIAIATLPLATVFSIEFTAPAWVALLAYPILREKVSGRAAIGIGLCFLGVLVVMRPGGASFDRLSLIALGAAFCFALSVLLTRRLVLTQSVIVVLFWMMVWQMGFYTMGLLAWGVTSSGPPWPSEVLIAIPLLGCAGLGSQLCLSKALQIGEATNVVPIDFLRVPIIAVIGWAFYGESLSFWVFGGAVLIMAGITYGLTPGPRPRYAAVHSPSRISELPPVVH